MFGIFGRVTISKSRLCSRPLCANDAEVLLLFEYETRLVELRGLSGVRDSNLLELCADQDLLGGTRVSDFMDLWALVE